MPRGIKNKDEKEKPEGVSALQGAPVENTGVSTEAPKPEKPEKQVVGKTYSLDEVQAMMQKLSDNIYSRIKGEESPAPKADDYKEARLSRIKGKFVVGFVNQNDDPYLDKTIHGYQKWDDRERVWVAWVEVMYQDGTTEHMPLRHFTETCLGITCEIVKKIEKDESYSLGKVERRVVKGYQPEGVGVMVDQKVVQKTASYVLKTPQGEEIEVPEYILNIGGDTKVRRK